MIAPLTHIVLLLAVLPLGMFLPRVARLVLLTVVGMGAMLALVPAAFWVISLTCLEGLALEFGLRRLPKKSMWRQYLPYVLLLNLFTTDLAAAFSPGTFLLAGVAFAVVRVFMTTKQLLGASSTGRGERWVSMFAGGFFLPALVVGPVFSGTTLWAQRGAEPELGTTESMYRKLAFGWFLSVLVTPWMFDLAGGSDLGRATAPLVMLALFANLFAGFWGQSLIAEAGAALSGFKVPQNFDQPWRATDIREFWNRWHISMAKFVTQYVFLPLNLRKVPPKVATISAFTFMGLWHEVRPGYIIWGVCHGVVMAFAPRVTAESPAWVRWTSRVLTLSLVVVLSYVANYAFA
ncbi:MAG: hypothetical protein RJB65_780 [Actinomycetota bacterium]